tara:strand:+ start:160 stop:510 length:351 start_codon:yes stop_codon:yes gene_type:complete
MRKVAKGNQAIFNREVEILFKSYGAIETARSDKFIGWELETKAGLLTINLYLDHTYGYSIFSRFKEPNRASELLGKDHLVLNHYSGKYNLNLPNVLKKDIATDLIFTVDVFFSQLL